MTRRAEFGEPADRQDFPFDDTAGDYDTTCSRSLLGTLMRRAVWRRLDACFSDGQRVLEVGCGTGEDAVHLAQSGISVLATGPIARDGRHRDQQSTERRPE